MSNSGVVPSGGKAPNPFAPHSHGEGFELGAGACEGAGVGAAAALGAGACGALDEAAGVAGAPAAGGAGLAAPDRTSSTSSFSHSSRSCSTSVVGGTFRPLMKRLGLIRCSALRLVCDRARR